MQTNATAWQAVRELEVAYAVKSQRPGTGLTLVASRSKTTRLEATKASTPRVALSLATILCDRKRHQGYWSDSDQSNSLLLRSRLRPSLSHGTALVSTLLSKRVKNWKVKRPLVPVLRLQVRRKRNVRDEVRSLWLASELHVRLLRSLVALLQVALSAARDQVFPGLGATHPARSDVVNRQISPLDTAVLTGVQVPRQNRMAR
jgi:hypothetical protein